MEVRANRPRPWQRTFCRSAHETKRRHEAPAFQAGRLRFERCWARQLFQNPSINRKLDLPSQPSAPFGDRILGAAGSPLAPVGWFQPDYGRECSGSVFDGQIDIAVRSLSDVPDAAEPLDQRLFSLDLPAIRAQGEARKLFASQAADEDVPRHSGKRSPV